MARNKYSYKILSNTADTLTIEGPVDLTKAGTGDTFAIVYGKLIKDTISLDDIIDPTPPKTGNKAVKFFNARGANSFADGDAIYDGVCEVCHTVTTHFRNDGGGSDPDHTNMGAGIPGTDCTGCHKHVNGFQGMGGGVHPTHVTDDKGPQLGCYDCHGPVIPNLADGQDLANTTVCTNCHSSNGTAAAKDYWADDPGTWLTTEGEDDYCGSCHDATPGNTKVDGTGDTTVNIIGDNLTYGYFVTGHGKASGNYARLSWQAASASGNPAANRNCSACHDLSVAHFNSGTKRLKTGYENDANNSNCKQCHSPGTVAVGAPDWYTTYADYQGSAHSSKKCTDCHDVHGAKGAYAGMTIKNQESLCYDCHTDGVVQNLAVSGSAYADDIEQAFGMSGSKHDLGTAFSIGGENYTLECISCHNVHVVTGKYWDADQGKSPVTLFSNNTAVWGDDFNEKMDFYAQSAANPGIYEKPSGSTHLFDGDELPDYATFCLECHQYDIGSISNKDWEGNPHGRKRAGYSGLGINYSTAWGPYQCPNGYNICGRATGWSGSTVSNEPYAWPVIPKGRGYVGLVKGGYDQAKRNAGLNYTLSCTDCHEAHGSDRYSLMRRSLNAQYDGTEFILSNNWEDKHALWSGGNPEGLCWSCHGGYQLTKEHFQWHYQKGYCSA
ncbi:MAG: hypothetical protein GTO60_19050 [Gammaproteobacteria bacterium]|nr:hypothetical protein [Gammaproteobacteria bacterium]